LDNFASNIFVPPSSGICSSISSTKCIQFSYKSFKKPLNHEQVFQHSKNSKLDLALHNYADVAGSFFGGVRIPASLIAGSSFGQLFALSKYVERNKGERFVVLIHNFNMFISFLLSLSAVVISTAANVSIIHGGFHPIATNGYMILKREFELQFITCRFAFLTSCFTFLIGVLSRGFLEFNLFSSSQG